MTKKKGKKEAEEGRSGGINFGDNANVSAGGSISGRDSVGGDVVKGPKVGGNVGGDVFGGSKAGGDIVGRDKVITKGVQADQLANLFQQVLASVSQQVPQEKQAEAEKQVAALEEQVKAKEPDLGVVGKSLKWLKKNVPGVKGALDTVLNQPIVGKGIKDIAAVILDDE